MEFDNILKLIKEVSDSKLTKFKYEEEKLKIFMEKEKIVSQEKPQMNVVTTISSDSQEVNAASEDDDNYEYIVSPIVGTFYASRSEGGEPLVSAGDEINSSTVIGIVEAMKLMNEIEAGISGQVVEVMVNDGQVVEYGQKLMKVAK